MAPVADRREKARERLEKQREAKLGELRQLEGFNVEYDQLCESLESLPLKLRHEVMVPLGSMAFLEGELRQTNEVLMHMGDDWFVERTTAKALETVNRRKAFVKEQMAPMEKEIQALKTTAKLTASDEAPAKGFAVDQDGFLEIRENFDDTASKAKEGPLAPPTKADLRRMAELERLEAEAEEREEREGRGREGEGESDSAPEASENSEDAEEGALGAVRSPADLYKLMEERDRRAQRAAPRRGERPVERATARPASPLHSAAPQRRQPMPSERVVSLDAVKERQGLEQRAPSASTPLAPIAPLAPLAPAAPAVSPSIPGSSKSAADAGASGGAPKKVSHFKALRQRQA